MRKRKHSKPPMEFSKRIMFVAGIVNLAVIIFSCTMIAITRDLTPLAYLIPSVAAEVATGTGFYYSKAKAENKIKLVKANNMEITDQTIIDF